MVIALLAGGTGGAKLAVGLRDLAAADGGEVAVIANTADDIEIYDCHVSPDPDLITFRLAGVLDDAGYGIAGETHQEMDHRRAAGEEIWFELGDEDLGVCRERTRALAGGASLTEAHAAATASYRLGPARVLPMSDEPVRTIVETPSGDRDLQRYLIQDRSAPEIAGVRFEGAIAALPSPAVLDALARADAIVIGPSNPIISIGPILAVPGMREAIASSGAPVIAVSPFVGGKVLKGPTSKFLIAAGASADTGGLAAHYGDLVDHWVADEPAGARPTLITGVEIGTAADSLALAREIAGLARSLNGECGLEAAAS